MLLDFFDGFLILTVGGSPGKAEHDCRTSLWLFKSGAIVDIANTCERPEMSG